MQEEEEQWEVEVGEENRKAENGLVAVDSERDVEQFYLNGRVKLWIKMRHTKTVAK